MSDIKVSVIVPVYNTGKYLARCLDSLAAQTFEPGELEIIVVDDGSTDDSGSIADDYAERYPNIRVIHQDNAGSSAARNAGIKEARGRYLGFVDSDDYVSPGMYSALYDAIVRNGVLMAQTGRDEYGEDGTRLPDVTGIPKKESFILADEMLFSLLMHEGDASFCTKLTDRTLFEDREFPVGMLNEDFRLLICMLAGDDGKEAPDRLVALPERDYHVFYRTGSNSRKKAAQKDYFPPVFTDIVVNADFAMELVKKRRPGILPAAKRFALVQRLDYLLHIPVSKMRNDNAFYASVKKYVRKHVSDIVLNPYLSGKERRSLLLLAVAPRTVRAVHKRIKKL